MILIEVKLVSAVDSKRSRLLGKAFIANDGTGTSSKGNYIGIFKRVPGGKEYKGAVKEFNRKKIRLLASYSCCLGYCWIFRGT